MGFFDIFKKAKDKVVENSEVIAEKGKEGIHKAGEKLDDVTNGKFSSAVEKGEDFAKNAVDKGEELLKSGKDKTVDAGKDLKAKTAKAKDKAEDKIADTKNTIKKRTTR